MISDPGTLVKQEFHREKVGPGYGEGQCRSLAGLSSLTPIPRSTRKRTTSISESRTARLAGWLLQVGHCQHEGSRAIAGGGIGAYAAVEQELDAVSVG